ncbi:MAG TPA: amidohydrolase family protein [Acidimicrobiales bacterium]
MPHDLVIRGGQVADGLGAEPVEADVAVDGGTIVGVGTVPERGREEVDADGLLVTPGFVDIHTHYDGQASWDTRLAPSSWHGVTTVVMGNCGVGFAPVRPDAHDRLISLMEGVEDIPGSVLHEGIDWTWESFGGYLDALETRPHDIDFCAQLPHGALRLYVMGERAARLEEATEEDAAAMRSLATEAMRAGAIGFTTSRTLNHRTATGDPTPSLKASSAELEAIALGVADAGHGVIELISDFHPDPESEFAMIRGLVERTGCPLSVSLAQSHQRPEAWRDLLAEIAHAAADGLPIKGQVAPRPIGLMFGLQGSVNPFVMYPTYREIARKPLDEQVRALHDPAFRARLLDEVRGATKGRPMMSDWSRMYPLGEVPDYEPPPETSVQAMADARGVSPEELALDLLTANGGRDFLFVPFTNYAEGDLEACREMLTHPDTVFGLGDGGAHVGIIADASFPTWFISHWARDRAHGRLPVGWVVEQLTSRTARAVGLDDRGVVAEGMKADLNVIDFDHLACEPPAMAYDLPAGGKRLLQRARGYRATIVNGEVTYRDGEPTGALPGQLVRGGSRGAAR